MQHIKEKTIDPIKIQIRSKLKGNRNTDPEAIGQGNQSSQNTLYPNPTGKLLGQRPDEIAPDQHENPKTDDLPDHNQTKAKEETRAKHGQGHH